MQLKQSLWNSALCCAPKENERTRGWNNLFVSVAFYSFLCGVRLSLALILISLGYTDLAQRGHLEVMVGAVWSSRRERGKNKNCVRVRSSHALVTRARHQWRKKGTFPALSHTKPTRSCVRGLRRPKSSSSPCCSDETSSGTNSSRRRTAAACAPSSSLCALSCRCVAERTKNNETRKKSVGFRAFQNTQLRSANKFLKNVQRTCSFPCLSYTSTHRRSSAGSWASR